MKVRLTENQYNSLIKHINEVVASDEALNTIIESGYKLVVYRKDFTTTFIVHSNMNGEYLNLAIGKKGPIDLKNTILVYSKNSLTNADYDGEGNKIKDSSLKLTKVAKYNKDEGKWEEIPPTPYTIKDVTKIDILNKNGEKVETIISDDEWLKQDEKQKDKGEEKARSKFFKEKREKSEKITKKEELKPDPKEVMRLIQNDPLLKKAFHHQPKLWNLISVGDPVGVSTTNKLINKYYDEKLGKSGTKLKKGNSIIFEVLSDGIEMSAGKDLNVNLGLGKDYKARVVSQNILKSVPHNKNFNFKIYLNNEIRDNQFKGEVISSYRTDLGDFKQIKEPITIEINDYNN